MMMIFTLNPKIKHYLMIMFHCNNQYQSLIPDNEKKNEIGVLGLFSPLVTPNFDSRANTQWCDTPKTDGSRAVTKCR